MEATRSVSVSMAPVQPAARTYVRAVEDATDGLAPTFSDLFFEFWRSRLDGGDATHERDCWLLEAFVRPEIGSMSVAAPMGDELVRLAGSLIDRLGVAEAAETLAALERAFEFGAVIPRCPDCASSSGFDAASEGITCRRCGWRGEIAAGEGG
jgi:hypothetical protein